MKNEPSALSINIWRKRYAKTRTCVLQTARPVSNVKAMCNEKNFRQILEFDE